MAQPQSAQSLGTSPAFVGLISSNPDGHTLMTALCDGPMAVYRAVSAALHVVDTDRRNLLLAGHHGFAPRIGKYQTVPLEWDFPVTRVFHTGEAVFVGGGDIDTEYPLLNPGRALLSAGAAEAAALGATLVVLPVLYAGALTAVCSVVVQHDGPWVWPDMTHLQGTCAAIGLWQRITELSERAVGVREPAPRNRIRPGGLTDRQRAIVELIRDGKSNASIAKALGFSVGTIKAEVQALLSLLSASDRWEIVRKADRAGITGNGPAAG